MSEGFYVPCAPFLYLVPDSAAPPGMELRQRSPGPFHYLINEQAKSLVALQELQNEVGALLEFRDLVMDTFPHLRNKMASTVTSSTPTSSPPSNIPIPLASSLNTGRREWEPGIRVRRKLPQKDLEMTSLPRRKTISHQPKSGDTSSAGSSAVQDSGFSTETSSSKEQCHSNVTQRVLSPKEIGTTQSGSGISSGLDEAEDELWNLLDVIHRKGTRLREEVECLQEKLNTEEKDKEKRTDSDFEREMCKASLGGGEGLAFMGDIMDIKDGRRLQDFKTGGSMRCVMEGADVGAETNIKEKFRNSKLLMNLGSEMAVDSSDEIRELRFERDYLLDKVAEMEAETLATRARASQLQTEVGSLASAKHELEDQLRTAVTQKCELNTRIHDLHIQFVGKPADAGKKVVVVPSAKKPLPGQSSFIRPPMTLKGASSFTPVHQSRGADAKASVAFAKGDSSFRSVAAEKGVRLDVRLGALDGIVSNPGGKLTRRVVPDRAKVAAILGEFNPVELQRHLLVTTVDNQELQHRLDTATASHLHLEQQFDKLKDDNDDLRFQLEEKNIDLEGTKAQVRVLERLHPPKSHPHDEVLHSSTESAHDAAPNKPADLSYQSNTDSATSPRKRPSRIPLGTKSYVAPKPPTCKIPTKEKSRESLNSTGKVSPGGKSLSQKNSLNGKGRDSLPGKRDSLSSGNKMNSYSSSIGGRNSLTKTKELTSYGSATGRKSLHRQLSSRRTSNVTRSNTTVIERHDAKVTPTSLHDHDPRDSLTMSPYKSTLDSTPPWNNNSSSSEYYDSINNSVTLFNNVSQLHSCSDQRDEYFNSSTQHEGLADFDSLELEIPSRHGKVILSRNVWATAESIGVGGFVNK